MKIQSTYYFASLCLILSFIYKAFCRYSVGLFVCTSSFCCREGTHSSYTIGRRLSVYIDFPLFIVTFANCKLFCLPSQLLFCKSTTVKRIKLHVTFHAWGSVIRRNMLIVTGSNFLQVFLVHCESLKSR